MMILKILPCLALLLCACSHQSEPDPRRVATRMKDLQIHFDDLDSDRDGRLTRAELLANAHKIEADRVDESNVGEIIGFYDFNKDGEISLREAQSGAVTGPEALIEKVG